MPPGLSVTHFAAAAQRRDGEFVFCGLAVALVGAIAFVVSPVLAPALLVPRPQVAPQASPSRLRPATSAAGSADAGVGRRQARMPSSRV